MYEDTYSSYDKGLSYGAYEKDEFKEGRANFVTVGTPGLEQIGDLPDWYLDVDLVAFANGTGFGTQMCQMVNDNTPNQYRWVYHDAEGWHNVQAVGGGDLDWDVGTWYFVKNVTDMQARTTSLYIYADDGTTLLGKVEDVAIPTGSCGDDPMSYNGDTTQYDLYGTRIFAYGGGHKGGTVYYNGISVTADTFDGNTLQMTLGETDFDEQIINKISDTAYAESWDGVTDVTPSKNAVYDEIEALISAIAAKVSDDAYAAGWDGVTDIAPSKNAVYDEMIKKLANLVEDTTPQLGGDLDCNGKKITGILDLDGGDVSAIFDSLCLSSGSNAIDGPTEMGDQLKLSVAQGTAPLDVTSTTMNENLNADMVDGADLDTDGTFAANSDTRVPSQKAAKTYADGKVDDTAFTSTWNADTDTAPSKDAIYDELMPMEAYICVNCDCGNNFAFGNDGYGTYWSVTIADTDAYIIGNCYVPNAGTYLVRVFYYMSAANSGKTKPIRIDVWESPQGDNRTTAALSNNTQDIDLNSGSNIIDTCDSSTFSVSAASQVSVKFALNGATKPSAASGNIKVTAIVVIRTA